MKKFIGVVLFLAIASSGAFTMERAFGFGFMFNTGNSKGVVEIPWYDGYNHYTEEWDWTMKRTGFGAFAFLGLSRFIEFNLGLLYKNPDSMSVSSGGYTEVISGSQTGLENTVALQLGIYGKYPFPVSDSLVIFPTAGVDFEFTLGDETGEYEGFSSGWWHDIWLRAGLGLDFFFSDTMFLRSHVIYGAAIPVGGEADLGLKIGHGLLLKVGLGWMF
ncbi:MAG: hypothetical protein FWG89_00100 [Treponema sp.]|nr:hypothetical protein [Treponema sp.]